MSKFVNNLVLIVVVHAFAAKFVSVYEGHAIGVIVIYFICAYEFIVNVLVTLGKILELEEIGHTPKSHK